MVRELAGHGYYVVAPHFLYRDGPVPLVELPGHIGEEVRPGIIGRLMPSIEAHLGDGRVERDAAPTSGSWPRSPRWPTGRSR